MTIQVRTREVYGEEKVYPVSAKAVIFALIAGTKTLTPRVLSHIEALGYTIEGR